MAVYDTTVSTKVLNIINVFLSERIEDGKTYIDGYRDLMVSLYNNLPNHDSNPSGHAWLFGINLHDYLSEDNIETLLNEAPAVMRYCYSQRDTTFTLLNDSPHIIPDEFIELFLKIVNPKEGSRVFLPYAGDAVLALCRPDCHYEGFEIDSEKWALSKMVLDVCGIDAQIRHCADSKEFIEEGKKYDYVFTFPPFLTGKEERTVIDTLSDIARYSLAYNGTMYCYLPTHFCNTSSGWFDFRKTVLEQYQKNSVLNIALGSILKPLTGIGICAFSFSRDNEETVVLEDATGLGFLVDEGTGKREKKMNVQFIVDTLNNRDKRYIWEGKAKDLKHPINLLPGRYLVEGRLPVIKEDEKRITVGELVELCVLQRVSSKNITEKELHLPVVGMRNLFLNYISCDIQAEKNKSIANTSIRILDKDSLVIGFINGKFKVGRIRGLNKDNRVILQHPIIAVTITNDTISEDFFLRSILSEEVALQANVFASGSLGIILPERDLLDIQITVPPREIQDKVCREDARKSLSSADKKLFDAFEEFRHDIHVKKHAIGQTIFNLNNWWDALQKARTEGNGVLNDNTYVGKRQDITVCDIFSNLQNNIERLQQQILKLDRGNGLIKETFSLPQFVQDFIATHQSPLFRFDFDTLTYSGEEMDLGKVNFPKEALTIVLENIVSNACSHGFEENSSDKNMVRLAVIAEGDNLVLTVENNGKPAASNVDQEFVFTYCKSTQDKNGHFGIGGYEVKKMMQEFGGDAEFFSNPEEEYSVMYKLTFYDTNM